MCDRKDITTRKRDYHLARGNTETDRKTKTNTKINTNRDVYIITQKRDHQLRNADNVKQEDSREQNRNTESQDILYHHHRGYVFLRLFNMYLYIFVNNISLPSRTLSPGKEIITPEAVRIYIDLIAQNRLGRKIGLTQQLVQNFAEFDFFKSPWNLSSLSATAFDRSSSRETKVVRSRII